MNHKYQKVVDFFYQHINDKTINIKSVKLIHHGLTNTSYLVKTNKAKYQVRFANQYAGINREIEHSILLQTSNLIYFDATGNMIKEWIEAKTFTKHPSQVELNNLFSKIQEFHNLKDISITNKMDYHLYLNNNPKDIYQEHYLKLWSLFEQQYSYELSHNDLTVKNILMSKDNITLIDYEWATLNYPWFDYVYYLIHSSLSHQAILKEVTAKWNDIGANHLFFVSYFCLSWINSVNDSRRKFKQLKRKYTKRVKYFYQNLH